MNQEIQSSEILFIYDAKLCNPNGDPDEENRPRIDIKTQTNLVSDVRLKRYFRDYIINKYGEKNIWVSKVEDKHVTSDEKLKSLKINSPEDILNSCIDVRLFGATIPIRGARGKSLTFTGPVQFSWGFSLNRVELVESSTITSVFVGREQKAEEGEQTYGTMGKDWRLYYSLIAFYGVINGRRAKKTGLKKEDIEILDNILWKAVSLEPTTRSKIGEKPHLYVRVEYKNAETLIGDLRKYIEVEQKGETIRDFTDLKMDFTRLVNALNKHKEDILRIYVNYSDEIKEFIKPLEDCFKDMIQTLPHGINEEKYFEKKQL